MRSRSCCVDVCARPQSTAAKSVNEPISATAYPDVSLTRMLAMLLGAGGGGASGSYYVSYATNGVNQLVIERGVDLFPQVVDNHVEYVGAGVELVSPYILGNQSAAHDPAGIAHEVLEYRVLLRGQLNYLIAALNLVRVLVQLEIEHLEHGRRHVPRPAAQHFHARQKLLEREGLGYVVIRARTKGFHLRVHRILCGEHEHRSLEAVRAKVVQHLES